MENELKHVPEQSKDGIEKSRELYDRQISSDASLYNSSAKNIAGLGITKEDVMLIDAEREDKLEKLRKKQDVSYNTRQDLGLDYFKGEQMSDIIKNSTLNINEKVIGKMWDYENGFAQVSTMDGIIENDKPIKIEKAVTAHPTDDSSEKNITTVFSGTVEGESISSEVAEYLWNVFYKETDNRARVLDKKLVPESRKRRQEKYDASLAGRIKNKAKSFIGSLTGKK